MNGWTICPSCDAIVVVQGGRHGKHWAEIGRRCEASATKVPEDQHVVKSITELHGHKR